jgi:hypothetical protein
MKLTIELVPEPCWYSNLRNQIEQPDWDKLRKQVYANYNHHCGICERTSKTLHCHEIWHYDDRAHIQQLEGFIALCPMCHHCKHIGYAGILAEQGKLDFQRVINHFCRVNACTQGEYKVHEAAAWRMWERRSQHRWKTDLGAYSSLIEPPPDPTLLASSGIDGNKPRSAPTISTTNEAVAIGGRVLRVTNPDIERMFWEQLEKHYVKVDKLH